MTEIGDTGSESAWRATAARHGWRIESARTSRGRARGLLGRSGIAPRHGLWLGTRSVHTVGMRFAIDLVWLAGDGAVRRVDRDVRPGRLRSCLRASGGVIEVAAGQGTALASRLSR